MEQEQPRPLLLNAQAAADELGVSRAKVYELVKAGLIDYRKPRGIGGVRFTRGDLDKYLADAHRPAKASA